MTSFPPPSRPTRRAPEAVAPPPPTPSSPRPGPPPPPSQGAGPEIDPGGRRPGLAIQNLLLVLGTGLVAVAMVVFTAVNWSRLDATAQGLVLVALTALAALLARAASRRSMPATAEAVALVALLLAIADVHAVRVGLAPALGGPQFWALGLAAVSAGAWGFGASTVIRSPRVAAWVLGQFPLYLLAIPNPDLTFAGVGAIVLAQGAVVATLAQRCGREPRWGRVLGVAQAGVASATMAAIAVGTALVAGPSDTAALRDAAIVAALASLVATLVAWLRPADAVARPIAQVAATALGLVAVHTAGRSAFSEEASAALVALVAALVALASCRLPARTGQVPGLVAGTVALLASVPLLGAMASVLVAGSEAAVRPGNLPTSTPAASLRIEATGAPSPAALLAHLAAATVLAAVAVLQVARRWVATAAAIVVGSAVVVAPVLVPLSVGGTAASGLLAAVAALALVGLWGGAGDARRPLTVATVVGYAWALLWALSSDPLTLATLWSGVVLAVVLAWVAARAEEAALSVAAGVATVVLVSAGVGVTASISGATPAMAWATSAAVVALASVIGAVSLDPSGRSTGLGADLARAVELTSLGVHVLALVEVVALEDLSALSLVLGTGALALAVHGTRPGRRWALAAAGVEAVVLTWIRLDAAEVTTIEAYTLPVAALLGAIGWYAHRSEGGKGRDLSSWATAGPALLVAFAPSVALVLVDPEPGRALLTLVAGAAALVTGAIAARRAPVDVGAVVVAAVGVRLAVPVVSEVPNWVIIGGTGVVLLAVGATFEQRRSEARAARQRYSALR